MKVFILILGLFIASSSIDAASADASSTLAELNETTHRQVIAWAKDTTARIEEYKTSAPIGLKSKVLQSQAEDYAAAWTRVGNAFEKRLEILGNGEDLDVRQKIINQILDAATAEGCKGIEMIDNAQLMAYLRKAYKSEATIFPGEPKSLATFLARVGIK